ncbi:hypothetical protein BFW01_g5263 [Lasiodiplodia theobromae]|nr:hypothetical protein BFW01_g5263 [Lasiodiplodia theobromae]
MASSLSSLTSSQQDTPEYYGVYTGMWTNWSRGRVLGSTITLSQRDGTLLIAFTAFFITLVSTSFWRIACFAFHTRFSTASARDGLHHQRQALLRNSANGASGLASLLLVLWSWRGGKNEAKHAYSRLLPLIIFTTVTLVLFAIASGFSSTISSGMGSEVLVSSDRCGITTSGNNDTFFNIANSYVAQGASTAFIYAQQCYSNTSNPGKCGTYVKPRLPVTVEYNVSCPFSDEMCYTQDGNIRFDSGLLDSLDDFGVNTRPNLRFQYRQMMECAPLNTTKFQVTHNYSDGGTRELYRQFWLGHRNTSSEVVYEHRELLDSQINRTAQSYELNANKAYSMNNSYDIPWTDFYPIDELRAPYADVSLFFLAANGIQFRNATDDPWFSAHRTGADPGEYSSGFVLDQVFLQDDPASVVGCVHREQLCNPNMPDGSDKCTPLSSGVDNAIVYPSIARDEAEVKALNWFRIITTMGWSDVYTLINVLGMSALNARQKVRWGLQGALPDNQWQIEVESWFNMAMAGLQMSYHEVATGPSNPDVPKLSDDLGGMFCHNQKMRSTAYTNISTLGLALIFGLGGFIIVLSYTIEPITACIQTRRRSDHYSRLEWVANDVLQLQRLAHEELGLGGVWRNCAGAVPTTERPDDQLGVLDVSDPEHPRLRVLAEVFEEEKRGAEEEEEERRRQQEDERKKNGGVRANDEREVSEISVSPTLTDGGDWSSQDERPREQRRGSS